MQKRITKAVFPVAGMGTRFLPATKASPKEMLPVVDKPLIQYAVEEALEAGITELIFITGRNKRSIEDHAGRRQGRAPDRRPAAPACGRFLFTRRQSARSWAYFLKASSTISAMIAALR